MIDSGCNVKCWFCYAGYRHVYLEGMEEASIFVHVAVNDITGKVGTYMDVQELVVVVRLVRG